MQRAFRLPYLIVYTFLTKISIFRIVSRAYDVASNITYIILEECHPAFRYKALSLALTRSAWVTFIRLSRRASKPASVHIALMSAPRKLVFRHYEQLEIDIVARFIFDVWMPKMWRFVFISGSGNSIFLSMRPGRIRAGSNASMRFVAMMTFTSPRLSNPSS